MKLIENTKFETITSDLAALENEYRLDAHLEIYSCKPGTTYERKAFKSFVSTSSSSAPDKDKEWLGPPDSHNLQGTSPSTGSLSDTGTSASSPGVLCDTISKKTFWYLVATLNASYGIDADFSDVQSQMFSREPSVQVTESSPYSSQQVQAIRWSLLFPTQTFFSPSVFSWNFCKKTFAHWSKKLSAFLVYFSLPNKEEISS